MKRLQTSHPPSTNGVAHRGRGGLNGNGGAAREARPALDLPLTLIFDEIDTVMLTPILAMSLACSVDGTPASGVNGTPSAPAIACCLTRTKI